jgi:hypothetical protein
MVLPKRWSTRNIQQVFKASTYIVHTSKILAAEKAIWSSPNVIPGKVLPPATAEMVKQFYVSDEIDRIMPRIKDNVCVNS